MSFGNHNDKFNLKKHLNVSFPTSNKQPEEYLILKIFIHNEKTNPIFFTLTFLYSRDKRKNGDQKSVKC